MNKGGSPVADKLKAAIIGAGTWGARHMPIVMKSILVSNWLLYATWYWIGLKDLQPDLMFPKLIPIIMKCSKNVQST